MLALVRQDANLANSCLPNLLHDNSCIASAPLPGWATTRAQPHDP